MGGRFMVPAGFTAEGEYGGFGTPVCGFVYVKTSQKTSVLKHKNSVVKCQISVQTSQNVKTAI